MTFQYRNPLYPKTEIEDPKRPYRLWDGLRNETLRWRCYSRLLTAHNGAMSHLRWFMNDGDVLQVFDIREGRCMGEYKRDGKDLLFVGPKDLNRLVKLELEEMHRS